MRLSTIVRFVILLPCIGAFESTTLEPLLGFDFQRSKCHDDNFPNLGQLKDSSLRRNSSVTFFSIGNVGLENHVECSEPMDSHLTGPVHDFLNYLQDDKTSVAGGISISLWLRSLQNDNHRSPILTIGRGRRSNAITNGITECDRRNIDLQLTLQKQILTLVFRTSDTFFEPCQKMMFGNLPSDELTHVAIVLTHRHQQLYINGKPSPVMKEPFHPKLTHWSTAGLLHFFSFLEQPTWNGRLYRFELFDQVWDQEDVFAMMSRGLLPAIPHVSDSIFRIYEDAEILPESHSAEWYEHPNILWTQQGTEDEVPILNFPITFLDEELNLLLKARKISHAEAPTVFVYITELPVQGIMYLLDGSKIDAQNDFILLPQRNIVFIPDHNTHSALPGSTYATIKYCVALHQMVARSQCLSTATVQIVVDSVNDPPLPRTAMSLPYIVREGIHEEPIPLQLTGWDVDQGDTISGIEIVSPPRFGYLFLSVPVRRDDNMGHGVLLSEIDYLIPGREALVEYRFNNSGTLVRDRVVMDSFDFRVRDTHGSWSVPLKVTIQVVSSVTVNLLLDSIATKEDSVALIPLGGRDQSGLNRSIGIFIESVPQQGALLLGNEFQELPVGTILDSAPIDAPYADKFEVGFKSTPDLCHARKTSIVSFGYRAIAYEADGRISSVSPLMERNITVECKVKPIGLAIPQDHFITRAFNGFMNDSCSGYNYNESKVTSTVCESIVVIDGINVTSDPTHTDRVLVSIRCDHGRLTLNSQYRGSLRLLQDQAVMRSSITFLSLPSDLNDVLSHLHFQSSMVGRDEIRILIQYGDCAPGDTSDEFQCFSTEKAIRIDILPEIPVKPDILYDTYPWVPITSAMSLLFLMKFNGNLRILLAENKRTELNDEDTTVANTDNIRWKQFYDGATGFYYYYDQEDSCVTWDPPLDEDFIPWEEIART